MKRAIVIGSGVAGLASSIRLAKQGFHVDVFEQNNYPGGKLTEIKKAGFRFDAGPSLFTMPHLVDELFENLPKHIQHNFKYKKLAENCRYFYPDGTHLIAHSNREDFIREAHKKTGVDEKKLLKHIKFSSYIYKHTSDLFLRKSLHKISSYLNLKTLIAMANLPFLGIFKSMDQLNKSNLKNDKMRQFFNRFATYNGSNPFKAPAILHIIPHLEMNQGAYFPEGGMHSITQSVFEVAKQLGVEFHFENRVEKIHTENGKAIGIKSNGSDFYSDKVICNMDINPTFRHLLKGEKQPKKVLDQEPSSSALIYYWGMDATFDQLGLHNIFFSEDYKAEFDAIDKGKEVFHDPTIYLNITCKEHHDDAPSGKENWFILINVPHDKNQDWDALKATTRTNVIRKLSKMLDCDIGSLILAEETLDPLLIQAKTGSHKGALYGPSSNDRMAAFFRHPNFSRKIKDLYFCGGSVHPGGGIPLALSSAKIVSEIIKKGG